MPARTRVNRYGLGVPDQRTLGDDQRSALPHRAGVPWWGAVLIAASVTLLGLAIEAGSGHQELGGVFAAFYALGCVAAVLAVRQSGIFTAVIQPPLLMFVAVPLAYYLFHESSFSGLKDALITCGYPLIERFPLMLFTSAATLLIGLIRWYFAMSAHGPTSAVATATPVRAERAGLSAKLSSAFAGNGSVDQEAGARAARPRHVADRPAGARRERRPQERATTHSRHARPPAADFADAPPRPRRDSARRRDADRDAESPRRRPRERQEPRRTPPPPRREARERAEYRDAPRHARGSRFEPHESGRGYQSHAPYQPYPSYEPPQRRPAPGGAGTSHHPVSRVRYRDSGPSGADRDDDPWDRPRR